MPKKEISMGPKDDPATSELLENIKNEHLDDYQSWVLKYDTLTEADRLVLKKIFSQFPFNPYISILMPIFDTPSQFLVKAIDSVRNQLYPYWELCISAETPTQSVRQILDEYANMDSRIHVIYQKNGHVYPNSNAALTLAQGEFIAFLDADDELSEHALFWITQEINQHPDVDLIYSDEDKITEKGDRFDPYFKSNWNPSLMLYQNVFSHLGVYRRSLVKKVGGCREELEGYQHWDLVFRCSEETTPERILHIPRILYHSRTMPNLMTSVSGCENKTNAWVAKKRVVEEHLDRIGISGTLKPTLDGRHQISYSFNKCYPKVSIIMPSACKLHLLKPCIETLLGQSTYPDFEILLVVNEIRYAVSEQANFLNEISSDPRIKILVYQDQEFNHSKINNWAIAQSKSPIICLMNDDIEVITNDWLEKLVIRVQISGVGAAGPLLLYPDNRIQHAGVILGLGGVAGHQFIGMPKGYRGYYNRAENEQDLSCITAACMVIRRDVFNSVGGFNESLAIAFNDVDLCIKIRKSGWRIVWSPEVELYHHEFASIGRHDSLERANRFQEEVALIRMLWGETLDNDPFYNPNLSLDTTVHNLSFPPRIPKLPICDVSND